MSREPLHLNRVEVFLDRLARTRTVRVLGWFAVAGWCVFIVLALLGTIRP